MEITIINKSKSTKSKTLKLEDGLLSLTISEDEAISLIRSLASQVSMRSPDYERLERYSKEGILFTIFVTNFKKTKEQWELEFQLHKK